MVSCSHNPFFLPFSSGISLLHTPCQRGVMVKGKGVCWTAMPMVTVSPARNKGMERPSVRIDSYSGICFQKSRDIKD